MQNIFRSLTAAFGFAVLLAGTLSAQKQQPSAPASFTMKIGQPIADVEQTLRDRRILFGEIARDVTKGNDDVADFNFWLDKTNDVSAVIGYSKSAKTVTGITLEIHSRAAKAYRVWMFAQSITLETDGSYSVHFLPPEKDAAKKPLKSVYPKQ